MKSKIDTSNKYRLWRQNHESNGYDENSRKNAEI